MHLSTVRLFVLVVAVLWPTLSAGGAAAQVTPVASTSPLHVAGNQLKDASNVTVALRGVNRWAHQPSGMLAEAGLPAVPPHPAGLPRG